MEGEVNGMNSYKISLDEEEIEKLEELYDEHKKEESGGGPI